MAAEHTSETARSARATMVRIVEHQRRTRGEEVKAPTSFSEPVLAAMGSVPRHEFVPPAQRPYAYLDTPLEIGEGQTISQPFMVALMTELSGVGPGSRVLEVGTGSGYQAAILAALGARLYTIEILLELAENARGRLERLGFGNVETRVGDGYHGWPDAAPYDAILVAAAAHHVPPPLVAQLATGGRLVMPLGPVPGVQELVVLSKNETHDITVQEVTPVRFVPFTRGRITPSSPRRREDCRSPAPRS